MKRRFVLLALTTIFPLLLLHCIERPRDNPFDPTNNQSPVTLNLKPLSDHVTLNWSFSQEVTDYQGFRLYRAVSSPDTFNLLADIPAGQFSYKDTSTARGRWYYYKVSVVGRDQESPPSNTRKTYLGQGEYWILTEDGNVLQKISYDLINTLFNRTLYLRASEWSVAMEDSAIWLKYPQYTKSFSEFSMNSGQETLYNSDILKTPVDIEFNPNNEQTYILDPGNASIVVFRNDLVIDQIPLGSAADYTRFKYQRLLNQLFILGNSQLLIISLDNNQYPSSAVEFPAGYEGKDLELAGNKAYILTASENEQKSIIYTITSNFVVEDTLSLSGVFYRLCYDDQNQWFYAAEEISGGADKVVQLSAEGNRQLQLTGFVYVEQIAVNPYDQTMIVVDYGNSLVSLYDKAGNFISSSRDFEGRKYLYNPGRIYIE